MKNAGNFSPKIISRPVRFRPPLASFTLTTRLESLAGHNASTANDNIFASQSSEVSSSVQTTGMRVTWLRKGHTPEADKLMEYLVIYASKPACISKFVPGTWSIRCPGETISEDLHICHLSGELPSITTIATYVVAG
jgi:hypothetical protein